MKIFAIVLIVAGLIVLLGFVGLMFKPGIPAARNSTKSKSMTREPN